jgi:hypothetical protein
MWRRRFRNPAPEGAFQDGALMACLKACPDTNRVFSIRIVFSDRLSKGAPKIDHPDFGAPFIGVVLLDGNGYRRGLNQRAGGSCDHHGDVLC